MIEPILMNIDKIKDVKFLILFPAAIILLYTLLAFLLIQNSTTKSYKLDDAGLKQAAESIDVAIVFGGGVSPEGPLPLLKERLDTAKALIDDGYVKLLVLSGDNRVESYNEPTAMYDYLLLQGVSRNQMQEDFAGRSTYETCERANKIFGLEKAILISEETHLPRAQYLCAHFGIETVGVVSEGEATAGLKVGQNWREILARNKALLNVYLKGEETILGDPISLQL